jgi:3-deoxy-7-phosphoheptulonate synthase
VPLENSLTGSIHENYDLLLEKDARIVGEVTLRIQHALIGLAGTDLSRIEQVTSHPQALQQCRQFLDAHPAWERVAAPNTSTAVRKVKEAGDPHLVAIAAREAARLHGLQVLKEGIETNPRNFTRFVVIGMKPLPTAERKKSSIVFATGNQPGALFESLRIFAEAGINLVKLESRPIQGKPWEYMFYVDLMADTEDEALAPILAALAQKTDFLRLLGSY